MRPDKVIGWYRGLPAWGRWLGVGVFLGALAVAALWYLVFGRLTPMTPHAAPGTAPVDIVNKAYGDAKRTAEERLRVLNEELRAKEKKATNAGRIAVEAAARRENEHEAIDNATDGDSVDRVIYGDSTDD